MSNRRFDEDDDADVDVELHSNDSNPPIFASTSTEAAGVQQPSFESKAHGIEMEIDPSSLIHPTDAPLGSSNIPYDIEQAATEANPIDSTPMKVKTELDLELEAKYAKYWGELKVRFTNRHFLKNGAAYLQTQQNAHGTAVSEEVNVGGLTFYTSNAPVLDAFLGMAPEVENS